MSLNNPSAGSKSGEGHEALRTPVVCFTFVFRFHFHFGTELKQDGTVLLFPQRIRLLMLINLRRMQMNAATAPATGGN